MTKPLDATGIPLLKSLKEHEEGRRESYERRADRRMVPNGIACPQCGSELVDVDRSVQLMSNPPRYNTVCTACDYSGYRAC